MPSRRKGESAEDYLKRNRVAVAEYRARKRAANGGPPPRPKTTRQRAEVVEADLAVQAAAAPLLVGVDPIKANTYETLRAATGVSAKLAAAAEDHANGRPADYPPKEAIKGALQAVEAAKPVIGLAAADKERRGLEALAAAVNTPQDAPSAPQGPPQTAEGVMVALGMSGPAWGAWRTVARMVDGTEFDASDVQTIRERTGSEPPSDRISQFWGVCGRRSGKTSMSAVCAIAWACRQYPRVVDPVVGIIARTREQAKVAAGYVADFAGRLGLIAGEVTTTAIPIKGGVTVRVLPNTASVRGLTYVAAILDEAAYYDTAAGAAWSDADLLTAVTPGLATVRRSLLMVISTPGPRRGIIAEAKAKWDAGQRPPGTTVWHARTTAMNPTISEQTIADLVAANPKLEAEFSASFFADSGAWLPAHVLTDEIVANLPERREPTGGELFAYFDLASGGGKDAAALAVAERLPDGRAALVTLIHKPPPFSPEAFIAECAAELKAFGIGTAVGDKYAAGLQSEAWASNGIVYEEFTGSKSDLYQEVLGPVLAGRVDWINHPAMIAELRSLVESSRATGRPKVDHPGGGSDDAANAAVGALKLALRESGPNVFVIE